MPALTSLALGGMALGGVSGAIKGAQGTPDQVQNTDSTTTSQTELAPASRTELELQQQSLQNYLNQVNQANAYEQGIGGAQGLQDQSRQGMYNILSGQGFQMTPEEQARVAALRTSMVQQGSQDVNQFLDQRLAQLQQDAGARGVRGQAYSQLQGSALKAAAEQQARIANQANVTAAQQALQLPQQRLQMQSPMITQGMSLADQMRIQAQQNRQVAQNPYLMSQLYNQRFAEGKNISHTVGQNVTPGHHGSFMDAVAGGLGGAAAGGTAVANFGNAYNSLGGGGGGAGSLRVSQGYVPPVEQSYQMPSFGSQYDRPRASLT